MAVDTKDKRFSMLSMNDGLHVWISLDPDNDVDQGDRQHFLDCYSGINFAAPAAVTGGLPLLLMGL